MSNTATIEATIAALARQLAADLTKGADIAQEAESLAARGAPRNAVVGTLLAAEAEIERVAALLATIRTLHRAG